MKQFGHLSKPYWQHELEDEIPYWKQKDEERLQKAEAKLRVLEETEELKRTVTVYKKFTFESAHSLNNYNGPCSEIHGHSYKLLVGVEGPINDDGFVIDFSDLSELVNGYIEKLDHTYLNVMFPFNPTAENIAYHLFYNLNDLVKDRFGIDYRVAEVELKETEKCKVIIKEY